MEKYSVASTLIKQDVNKMNVMVDIRHINANSQAEAIGIYMVEISEQFPEHHVHAHPVAIPSYNSDYEATLKTINEFNKKLGTGMTLSEYCKERINSAEPNCT